MASGNRSIIPIFTALDVNGEPIPGAKLYYYVNNSSTPKDTWADVDLITTNPFPVEADAAGRFTDDIFLDTTPYRIVLTDAYDVVIWDKSDCNTLNTPASTGFPYSGAVIDFWGDQDSLDVFTANNWFIMDGSSGVPNLNESFIKGCVDVAGIGDTGGTNADITIAGSVDGHSLTTQELATHSHFSGVGFVPGTTKSAIYSMVTDDCPGVSFESTDTSGAPASQQPVTSESGLGDSHTHGLSVTAQNFQPQFYTLIKLVYLP